MASNNFVPLGPVPEDYQTQTGMSYRNMPMTTPVVQGMDAYANVPGMMATEMDVDFWWDQSYGAFDMEVIDQNANAGVESYQFQNFSMGSGF